MNITNKNKKIEIKTNFTMLLLWYKEGNIVKNIADYSPMRQSTIDLIYIR